MSVPAALTFGAVAILVIGTAAFSGYRAGWSLPAILGLSLIAGAVVAALAAGS